MSEVEATKSPGALFAAEHRMRTAVLLGAVTSFAPFAIDMYLGSLGDVARSLDIDAGSVQITVSTFFAGMAVGQLFYGPAIDRLGRRGPLLFGIALFSVMSILIAFAPNLSTFVVLRFFEAFGGCAGMIIARAIIRDVYDLSEAASMLGLMMLVQGLGPILAPIVGARIVAYASWHWVFVVLAVCGLFWMAAVAWGLPETLAEADRRTISPRDLLRGFRDLAVRIDFILPAAVSATSMGAIFAFIGASASVFMDHFALDRDAYSLVFGANAVCMIAAAQVNRMLVERLGPKALVLGASAVGTVGAIGLLVLSGTASWIVFAVPMFLTLATCPVIGANAQAIAMSRSGERAGLASSLIGIVQYVFAGAVIAAVGLLHDGSTIPMTATILACFATTLATAIGASRSGHL